MFAYDIRWMDEAREDLIQIHTFYAKEASESVADRIITLIELDVNSLRMFAMRARPGRIKGTRELVIAGLRYVACVAVQDTVVTVIGVAHTARKYPPKDWKPRLAA
jgi:toxin ParE1/3/4